MPYATGEHFDRMLEGFATAYYGTQSDNGTGTVQINVSQFLSDIQMSYDKINVKLDSIDRIPVTPIGTQSNGSHHPYLIEWNVCDTIYTKIRSRHLFEYGDNMPEWIKEFGSRSQMIESMIVSGDIVFETDTTNKGIGYPIRVTGSSIAKFYSNWDSGYYEASDYPREYHFKINDVSGGTNPNQAKFIFSKDSGISYETGTYTTGTDWIDVEKGLKVRWGYSSGTNQLALNDEWKITCIPVNTLSTGQSSQFKRFKRG